MMIDVLENVQLYEVEGLVGDNGWLIKNRELLEEHLREDMRANNVLPVLDLPIDLSCTYDDTQSLFKFSMVASGCVINNIDANEYMGLILSDGVLVSMDLSRVLLCES